MLLTLCDSWLTKPGCQVLTTRGCNLRKEKIYKPSKVGSSYRYDQTSRSKAVHFSYIGIYNFCCILRINKEVSAKYH
jgi:hypothetical protein